MTTNKRPGIWLLVVLAVLVTGSGLWVRSRSARASVGDNSHRREPGIATLQASAASATNAAENGSTNSALTEEILRFLEATRKDPSMEWRFPINFWGNAVDENDRPLEGVGVHFTWTDISRNGTSEQDVKSDTAGLFSLQDRRGKHLSVDVEKAGYYPFLESARMNFEYARPGERFVPDRNNPIIFRLKKAGKLELLIAHSVQLPVSNSGKLTEFDFIAERWMEPGVIQFQCEVGPTDEQSQFRRFSWKFRMTVPGGGLIVRTNWLDFEAPATGYTERFEVMENEKSERWGGGFNGTFFVKFGNPARYGRIRVSFGPLRIENYKNSSVGLDYWVNPSGSRNLEADPAKPLKEIPEYYWRIGLPPEGPPPGG